jgi:anti-anti-sigma regulatory factor
LLNMTFKIERTYSDQVTALRLIGRLKCESLEELKQQMEHGGSQVVLDLSEVDLVDVEVVRFLGNCEAQGATLLNCSPYLRNWIGKERA